jgi:GNAT superfamily N-acetyltransferase
MTISSDHEKPVIRRARIGDRERLRRMQARAFRVLGRGDYTDAEIDSFLAHLGTMDDFLLHEGTYYMVEIDGCLAACGGWSRRTPHQGKSLAPAHALEAPVVPWIRSIFVDPRYARRGLATRLMELAEREAAFSGYRRLQLTATLTGVPLYRSLGYETTVESAIDLPDGQRFRVAAMRKDIAPTERRAPPGLRRDPVSARASAGARTLF